jgi:hypothetical protein
MPDYNGAHRRLRAALLSRYVPGLVTCWRCQRPITTLRLRDIHLGHSDSDPRMWMGLEHAYCSTSAGAAKGNQGTLRGYYARRTRRPRRSRIW